MVINCTPGMELKLQKIVVVAAAERYLGVPRLEDLQGGGVASFQAVGLK